MRETENNTKLQKSLRKRDLLALGFGAIIGWGWLSMGKVWITSAGSVGACVAFAVVGVMMCFIGLAFCELTAAMPKAGGVMNYTWRAFGPRMSFFAAWMMCLGYTAMTAWDGLATVAAVDFLFPVEGNMILYSVAGYDVSFGSLAVALIVAVFMFFITLRGMNTLSKFNNISVIIMVVIVIVFAIAAFVKGDTSNLEPKFTDGFSGVVSICLMCALFLGGFDTIPQAAEEANIPRKSIGSILLGALGLAIAWYFVTILATSMSLSSEEIGNTTLAAGTAMDKIFGTPIAGKILVISGILGILTSWVALYIGATRLLYSMARVGMLPKVFAKLHPKYKTPYIATYVVGITTFIAPFFGYQALQWLSNAGGWAINFGLGMAALSFLVLRFKEPDMERPYRVPCGKLIGLLAVIMSFTLIIICFPGVSSFSLVWPYEAVIVIGWLLIGIILFIFTNRTGSFREVNPKMKALMFDTHEDSGNDSV